MKNFIALLFFFLFTSVNAQITLTHNVGNVPVVTDITSCEDDEYWGRTFTLSDFGITTNEQFIIRSGQVAISRSYGGANLSFGIFSIDSDFPNSDPKFLGGSQGVEIPVINGVPEIINVDFNRPIVVPVNVEKILVRVNKYDRGFYNPTPSTAYIAGTQYDNDISWYLGCSQYYSHTPTTELDNPVPDANFFIYVTGEKFNASSYGSKATLTHNLCDDLRENQMYACSSGGINWGRTYTLDDFGISNNEEYIIESGQIALAEVGSGDVNIQFKIYSIDDNFPATFSDTDLIGSSQIVRIYNFGSNPQIINVDFDTPIVVPANIDKILVEVFQLHGSHSAIAFTAGTNQFNDDSWFRSSNGGCPPMTYTKTSDLGRPDTNFYINVTGNVNHVTNNFEMNISNICSEFLKEFSVSDTNNASQVVWDFGDPASGVDNTSTDLSPFHDFSSDGTYTVTATVTANTGTVEVLTETIQVKEPPNAYGINNLMACEDDFDTGFSSTFDTSNVLSQVLGGQTNKTVTFIDGSGNEYNVLPNPFTNTVKDRETITVRIARNDELCCYSEITFDLIVNPLPDVSSINNLEECDDDTDGFALFDLSVIENDIVVNNANTSVEFYYENGTQIIGNLAAVENQIINEETINLRLYDNLVNCYNEITFKLIVNTLPIAYPLEDIIGCDDNSDGISEYFDLTDVESTVLGNQTGMEVSYYDANRNILSNPLPNPYTNAVPNQEVLTVRVTNTITQCFSETQLRLTTSEKPNINTPLDKYACDYGNGISTFDLSGLENEIIGNQNNLNVYYFDSTGNEITGSISSNYRNSQAWNETITVKVENVLSTMCFTETSFNLIVNALPEVTLEESYFLCNLEPSLPISVNQNLNSWEWKYQDGTIVSNNFETNLIDAGNYSLRVTEISNGIECENTYNFELIRSVLPNIENVEIQELSNNNYIKIIASGDGDFEYSIDGVRYQDSNTFNSVLGGIYTVYVRDKYGCGGDQENVVIIDYPKFFTPNNDGINDYWQIRGVDNFNNIQVFIYDRYGKLLKQLSSNSNGWDGTFNGELLPSSDYWFTANLDNTKQFKGHFTLKR
ncbi:T9SS type B sorting domain-containing protein [Flavobacteriaceae bacterium S0825]|uniref:T9SS type B sorting domain-containing protein n=1 Tax=Gaetbulibacter sp. S0825 TaxID=2720084 RepID=UPI00142F9A53|nr:T9SS type B sorting domain-containing protein [Gaetbulibacter sp. S0825]MCK0110445.1 T9SS type B sorting domain-containing protein [Flavobacteriaceae bacterium S0825]NIX66074.1 T9SS type B sorting domain-containing protein [Gaetbulibacter sp. S0825]